MTVYRNPVWPGYFADPFVLKVGDEYYAYGTGPALADGRVFPILYSRDLLQWEAMGGALTPPEGTARTAYWAPEAAERDGRFYLYYSAADGGGDETHRLYAAVSDHPVGPFTEAGPLLPGSETFAIDPHPFRDPADGRWYLVFATDFFDARPGTALAGMLLADDMVSAAGPVTTLLRASHDWQIYERQRPLYGRVWDAWHTLEGPTLLFHAGRYVLLYSGGNWNGGAYGVGYAVADTVLGPYAEPEAGPVVLSGVEGQVIGPGHCSVTTAPGGTEFVVYHAWDTALTARRMCLDPLAWSEGRPRCLGPTYTEQVML